MTTQLDRRIAELETELQKMTLPVSVNCRPVVYQALEVLRTLAWVESKQMAADKAIITMLERYPALRQATADLGQYLSIFDRVRRAAVRDALDKEKAHGS